jgi:hypothetical protein
MIYRVIYCVPVFLFMLNDNNDFILLRFIIQINFQNNRFIDTRSVSLG